MSESVARHDRDIRRMAYTDSLTGLSNRLAFRESLDERLHDAAGASGELALLFVDLDDFKRVNDTLGHEAGDEVLRQLSMRIRRRWSALGGAGAEIARFGGDEFIVLFRPSDIRSERARPPGRDSIIEEVAATAGAARAPGVPGRVGGHHAVPVRRRRRRPAAQERRHRDVPGQGRRQELLPLLQPAMDQAVERRVQLEHDLRGAWDRGELSLALPADLPPGRPPC